MHLSSMHGVCVSTGSDTCVLYNLLILLGIFVYSQPGFSPPRSCLDTFALVFFRHHSDDLHSDVAEVGKQASSCHEGSPIGVAASGVEADRELKNEYS